MRRKSVSAITLERALRDAAARFVASQTPRLDARVLAKHALGLDDAGLIVEARRQLTAGEIARLEAAIGRREAGEPVAYIVGEKEFRGLTFRMAPGVLVPRPDSETLIEAALARREAGRAWCVLDLGVGSGALLASILCAWTRAEGVGVDRNETAARLATENFRRLGLSDRASALVGDWGRALSGGRFDVILSNPPYIADRARDSLPRDVILYEDPRALFGGEDGLDAYRTILSDARRLAAPGALMVLELGAGQSEAATGIARNAFPGAQIGTEADLAGVPRALVIDLYGSVNSPEGMQQEKNI